jgi:2'-5' RNA ligase
VLYFPTSDYLPLLDSLQDSLGAYFESMNGVRVAARESSIVKYKLGKLKQQMWSKNSELAREHMSLVQKAKSVLNAFVVDADEDVTFVNRSLAGVADLPNPIMAWVAAALGIPNTVFWQVSPGGFGKGESERDTFHEDANAFQEQVLTSPLTKVHGYIIVAKDGGIELPIGTRRKVEFNDLTPPDESQRSKLRSEAISDLRQLAKEGLITRTELRAAIAQLNDEFFNLELDEEFVDRPAPAQVGIFTGSAALLQAVYGENIPPMAVRALLIALDPVHFNAENITSIVPIETPPEPVAASPATSGTPPVAGTTDPALGDEEDGEREPSEVDIVWSEVAPPPEAKTAKELAEDPELGASSRNIKRLAREGKLTAYRNRGYSTEPLFVAEEVKRALLERQGQLATEATEDKVSDIGPHSLIVSFPLPKRLAQWVPYKADDTSPPHVTLSYTKDVPPERLEDVLDELRETFASFEPIDMRVVGKPVQYFDNEDARIAHARVEFSESQELFDDLAEAFASFGYSISKHGEYKPHVTLAYLDAGEDYTGPVPDGEWTAGAVEVFYGGEVVATLCLTNTLEQRFEDLEPETTQDKGPLVTEGRIWRTQKDGKVRPEHKKLEGKRYPPGKKDPKHGEPGDDPNCRCAWEVIVPPTGTKRARAAAERTTRRALRQRYESVTGKALKRAAAKA